jgi:hypothetical protein
MSRDGIGARELARMLAQRAPALAAELFPRGRKDGPEWRVGSLAGEAGQSLAVRLTGAKAGVWQDFASGEGGDALDLAAAVLCGGDTGEAMKWARRWLGLGDATTAPAAPLGRAPEPAPDRPDPEAAAKRRQALALFAAAREPITGTPAAAYLAARGIHLAELGRVPRALRFHPACWSREAGGPLPAMLAAITGPDGEHVATHRTYLAQRPDRTWGKAPLRDPKLTIGSYSGGAIRLWRGASGRPLAEAEPGETVALAEGIETALSVALAAPELRVLCAVSSGNMPKVELPPAVSTVVLCADNDSDNAKTAKALADAVERFTAEGCQVRIARPPAGCKDFNDALNAGDRA